MRWRRVERAASTGREAKEAGSADGAHRTDPAQELLRVDMMKNSMWENVEIHHARER
ncbi:hypothetical protein KUV65_07995 [Maritalea mobilis]|uniref:hypothetical protein n=1 Tax=Maritalea mobilis TaxID=483324 RepID=UPI001C98B430|nr:hypothetical protein [Maritalea mobilis]MBY6201298.1 hypothetical protein [Maritalea mobilis]